jgi:predicted nucleic acid-binding protein
MQRMPEKKWIFDTVALSNFVLANSIFILEERYRKCGIITWEVYDEICGGITDYPDLKQVDKLIESNVFNLISLSRAQHKHFLELIGHLGKGEASCIAFAKEQNATVVTDDRTARKQCSLMKIPFTGTVGILKAALLDGQITLNPADDILSKMIKKGFYSPIRSFADIL